jgi:hypothetical protein
MTRFLPSRKADCLTSAKKACLPYHCSLMVPKRKRALRPFLFATFRYCLFLSSAQRRMDALQANHDERPANPCGRAHPFSSVHPYGPPCESRAEAPGPSCLQSIAALSRLLQWRPLRLALTLRTTVSEMASTAFELPMVAASMLTALQPPIVICHLERACE